MAGALFDMGCYEVSMGDTTGAGTPASVTAMLEATAQAVPVQHIAAHLHDTYGQVRALACIARVFACLPQHAMSYCQVACICAPLSKMQQPIILRHLCHTWLAGGGKCSGGNAGRGSNAGLFHCRAGRLPLR